MAENQSTQLELFPQGPYRGGASKRFTPEQERAIIADYEGGMSSPQVARKWNCGHAIVQRIVRRNGGRLRTISAARKGTPALHKRRFTPETDMIIRKQYEARVSTNRLAEKHKCCIAAINAAIRRAGGTIRNLSDAGRGRILRTPLRCTLNEAAFDDAENSPKAMYFAGLLHADGCVEARIKNYRPHITLRLKTSDAAMIYAFRDFLGSSHKVRNSIHNRGHGKGYSFSTSLAISSRRLASALARFGIVPRKSLTATVPDFLIHNRDWWRGSVDGDGWIWFGKDDVPRVGLCGSRETCEKFLVFVQSITPTKTNVRPSGPIWCVTLGHHHAIRVANALYRDCEIALPRKWEAAKKMMAMGQKKGILPPIAIDLQ